MNTPKIDGNTYQNWGCHAVAWANSMNNYGLFIPSTSTTDLQRYWIYINPYGR